MNNELPRGIEGARSLYRRLQAARGVGDVALKAEILEPVELSDVITLQLHGEEIVKRENDAA